MLVTSLSVLSCPSLPSLFRYLLLIAIAFSLSAKSAVCVTAGSGNWTNTATWSCGSVPACGDSIVILAGHTVSIVAQSYDPCAFKTVLVIKGTLRFTSAGKLELSCLGRVYIFSGGQIVAGNGQSGNSNAVMQCSSTWWNAGAGTYNGPGCMPPFLAGCASVLPIELLSFVGETCEDKVCFTWQTAVEINHSHFEVLRSEDGTGFQTISTIYEQGVPFEGGKKYVASDPNPIAGVNYYRLKQVDRDGREELFPLIAVNVSPANALHVKIVPNPNRGKFTIITNSSVQGAVSLRIYDPRGKQVLERSFHQQLAEQTIVIDCILAQGVYYAELLASGSRQIQKLIISQ